MGPIVEACKKESQYMPNMKTISVQNKIPVSSALFLLFTLLEFTLLSRVLAGASPDVV